MYIYTYTYFAVSLQYQKLIQSESNSIQSIYLFIVLSIYNLFIIYLLFIIDLFIYLFIYYQFIYLFIIYLLIYRSIYSNLT